MRYSLLPSGGGLSLGFVHECPPHVTPNSSPLLHPFKTIKPTSNIMYLIPTPSVATSIATNDAAQTALWPD